MYINILIKTFSFPESSHSISLFINLLFLIDEIFKNGTNDKRGVESNNIFTNRK
jgi:hypothetical protein